MSLNPSWKSNLALFLALILLVSGYFFLQLHKASAQFYKNSREHSEVVAGVVELTIKTAITSSEGLENIYRGFLKNSARFLFYLEEIEPFSAAELTAFAAESGLSGITIIKKDIPAVSGPPDWLPDSRCFQPDTLIYQKDIQTYLLTYYPDQITGASRDSECILVGIAAKGLDRIRRDLSVEQLLRVLNKQPRIAYVTLNPQQGTDKGGQDSFWRDRDGRRVIEHAIDIGDNRLIVALEAGHFQKRIIQMRKELGLFVLFLLVIGFFTSWWLYRSQRNRLDQAREFERQLAKQHEEAALGRASSTITHELRNPLNAISIGLQRLQYEADELGAEHRQLLTGMREAVARSNNVINRLRQYIHDFRIEKTPVNLGDLMTGLIDLYRKDFADHDIELAVQIDRNEVVPADRELLGQLFENLIRNALEAQQTGGFFSIIGEREFPFYRMVLTNGGLAVSEKESTQLFDPYFTTKAKGTGLGLAISRKIVEAHGGTIDWNGNVKGKEFSLVILLPLTGGQT